MSNAAAFRNEGWACNGQWWSQRILHMSLPGRRGFPTRIADRWLALEHPYPSDSSRQADGVANASVSRALAEWSALTPPALHSTVSSGIPECVTRTGATRRTDVQVSTGASIGADGDGGRFRLQTIQLRHDVRSGVAAGIERDP